MSDILRSRLREIVRETYEGALPGEGTEYLDHASGIWNTLRPLSAERASARPGGHPSIAAHARHMAFHLRVSAEWVAGIRMKRDWPASFEPQTVDDAGWQAVLRDLDEARTAYLAAMTALPAAHGELVHAPRWLDARPRSFAGNPGLLAPA